jgi:hypothetical protein
VALPSSISIPMIDSVLRPTSGHHVGLPDMSNVYVAGVDGSQACELGHMSHGPDCMGTNEEGEDEDEL